MKFKLKIFATIFFIIVSSQFIFSQSIKNIEGLRSITFYEKTGNTLTYTFDINGEELNTKLSGRLGYSNFDFQGWPGYEFFDVYFSSGDGSFNSEGKFVSIEARFDNSYRGGGGNIIDVKFNFENDNSIFASHLESYNVNGTNYAPQSELKSVDCNMDTWSSLGNTRDITQNLRLTVGIQNTYKEINYVGCRNDKYSVEFNGTIYNEDNPIGTEMMANSSGCISIVKVELEFEDCGSDNENCIYYIPNGFSPNGDDCNDFFSVFVTDDCEIKDFKINIYNRWGDEVFKSNDVNFQWNGTFKGGKVNARNFIWVIEYNTVSRDLKQTLEGKVRILK